MASASLNAFRVREHELDSGEAQVSLKELLSVAEPRGPKQVAIREAQLEALIRMVPATLAGQFAAAALVVICLYGMVPHWQLYAWLGAALGLSVVRGYRAYKLRSSPSYAQRRPPDAKVISRIIIILATMWLVPFGLWFRELMPFHQTVLFLTGVGLMSVGTVSLTSLPRASLGYILIIGAANMIMAAQFGSPSLVALGFVYCAVLVWAALTLGRRFYVQVNQRYDLIERGELVELLREFEASGSGGIWELDSDLRLTRLSDDMAQGVGSSAERMVGRHVRTILDPRGQVVRMSEGMRTLFHHLDSGVPFRDLAIPAFASKNWWSLSGKPVRDSHGRLIGWRGVGSDITEIRLTGSDSVRAARRDPLTGLANRLLVREHLEEALMAQMGGQGPCSLLLVDLDRFKLVNDTLGHAVGDQLLCAVARRLEAIVGAEAHVGRLGGDEFAVILFGDQSDGRVATLARRIIADISRTFVIGAARLHVGATIGIARGGVDGAAQEALMRAADLALYQAKEAGRGSFALFTPEMYERAENRRLLENDVREALSQDALSLHYQPIIDALTGEVAAREALLRWEHPVRGAISPEKFIPIIEDAGLIHQIGDWVIREACREASGWDPSINVAVNISAAQLSGSGLAETVLGAIAATGLAPDRLELEVTESIFLGEDLATLASLERLRSLGVRLVLDDFGKGYSSFGYLSRAQFAKIKIEQAFVRGAAGGERDCLAIVNAIIALARGLGVETTAEGVETEVQAAAMRALGCNQLQGFRFGRPAPAADFRAVGGEDAHDVRNIA